jgi:hypothetical protein
MRDRNEVLFYRLLAEHLEEMLIAAGSSSTTPPRCGTSKSRTLDQRPRLRAGHDNRTARMALPMW